MMRPQGRVRVETGTWKEGCLTQQTMHGASVFYPALMVCRTCDAESFKRRYNATIDATVAAATKVPAAVAALKHQGLRQHGRCAFRMDAVLSTDCCSRGLAKLIVTPDC